MSIKLIDYNKDSGLFNYANGFDKIFWWAKACRGNTEEDFILLQSPVTCKDYVVDTQYRTSGCGWNFQKPITQKQRSENCVVFAPTSVKQIDQLYQMLETFIHPLEKSLDLELTTIHPVDLYNGSKKQGLFVLVGDNAWNTNGLSWSLYLSIVRACAFLDPKIECKTIPELFLNTASSEQGYYNRCILNYTNAIKWFTWLCDNIPELFVGVQPTKEKKFNKYTGYSYDVGHGETGQFNLGYSLRTQQPDANLITCNYWISMFLKSLQ